MHAANHPHSILSLPQDIFIETLKQLSAVNQKTPWRDVLRLGATCKTLNNLTRSYCSDWMKNNWPAPPEGSNWQVQLEKILSFSSAGANNLENRLFREPMLRQLTMAAESDRRMGRMSSSNVDFWVELDAHRESTPEVLAEIFGLLKDVRDLQDEDKSKQLEKIAERLPLLSRHQQGEALNSLSTMLATDAEFLLGRGSKKIIATILKMSSNNTVDTLAAAGFALKIQFGSLDGIILIPNESIVAALNCLPSEVRFGWLKKNIPAIFTNHHGIRCLAMSNSACADLVANWNEISLNMEDAVKLFHVSKYIEAAENGLINCDEGRALLATAFTIFLDLPMLLNDSGNKCNEFYLTVLKQCIRFGNQCLDDQQLLILKDRINACLVFTSRHGYFADAALVMFKIAQFTPQLLPSIPWASDGFMSAAKYAANNLRNLRSPDDRYVLWKAIADGYTSASNTHGMVAHEDVKLAMTNAIQYLPAEVQNMASDRFAN